MKRKMFMLSIMMTLLLTSTMASIKVLAENEVDVNAMVDNMTIREVIGQKIIMSFRSWEGSNWTEYQEGVQEVIDNYHLGGAILFAMNTVETAQMTRLIHRHGKATIDNGGIPLFFSVDQEGGIVTRLKTGSIMTGNMALGAANDLALTEEVGSVIGSEIAAVGFNVNHAPVVDVNSNYKNPVIGVRSFGEDPVAVGNHGIAYVKGLNQHGVAGTVKHFPGHGDTETDSHYALPIVNGTKEQLLERELKPFQMVMDEGVDMVMTAHISMPALDDTLITPAVGKPFIIPATLSRAIMTDLIRDEMGYQGVTITDALEMQAIASAFTRAEATVKTFQAGVDIALMPVEVLNPTDIQKLEAIYVAVENAITSGELSETEMRESAKRILTLKKNRGLFVEDNRTEDQKVENALAIVGSQEHRAIERKAVEKSVTILKNESNLLPINAKAEDKILLLSSNASRANSLEMGLKEVRRKTGVNFSYERVQYGYQSTPTNEQLEKMKDYDYIIMDSNNVNSSHNYIITAINYAVANDLPVIHIATRNPYDIAYFPEVKTSIAIYNAIGFDQTDPSNDRSHSPSLPISVEALFGLYNPSGTLPVNIPDLNNEGQYLYRIGHGYNYLEKVDVTNLEALITEVEAIDTALYTDESVLVLTEALNKAKDILSRIVPEQLTRAILPTQDTIDDAYNDLLSAKNGLVKKSVPITTEPEPTEISEDVPPTGVKENYRNLLALIIISGIGVATVRVKKREKRI